VTMPLDQLIASGVHTRTKHDNVLAQQAALAHIPSAIVALPNTTDDKVKQLLRWFKHEFFTWTNAPKCAACNGNPATTKLVKVEGPKFPHEVQGEANAVEVYSCSSCGSPATTRFPRYNNPITLLSTRTGRCGEWANCFTLCAVACGLQARYVLDATDHVWTEVFSLALNRWVHCDSCEEAFDTPLVYEAGWGKRLTYVLAFGPGSGQCTDVTRRYSRRWDADMIITRYRMATLRAVEYMQTHRHEPTHQAETDEFMESLKCAVPLKPEEMRGRLSGSVEWRMARGEMRSTSITLTSGDGGICVNGKQVSPMRRGVNCVCLKRESSEYAVFTFDTLHDTKALQQLRDLIMVSEEFDLVLVSCKGDFKWPDNTLFAAAVARPFVALVEHRALQFVDDVQLDLPFPSPRTRFLARFAALVRCGVKPNAAVVLLVKEFREEV
jgi:peptide-N4-(N-acetyl-beta-glucosaminyl)asparagine amidase